ncbi:hypothetical protein HS1genome_2072 [Sulfodiicoccus acidiphilus]|uniref:Uncharacterized protein n=1 Tax=Sulfodiicoccus acidiphilus TaxID=1670455 RepID=A0A348B681_9CREN|nr:hypothetical protein HS1genome_2072 [Sulfodiicoccus acidiphilus]GGT97655.1 hypothetical protein GCM10007116_13910 [Sulfodiicoccus acidiphilus]
MLVLCGRDYPVSITGAIQRFVRFLYECEMIDPYVLEKVNENDAFLELSRTDDVEIRLSAWYLVPGGHEFD